MKSTKELILYKGFENGKLFQDFTWLMENYENDFYNRDDIRALYFECMNQLMELSVSHGFEGNLWHCYLAFLMVNHENAYSTACEMKGEVEGSINQVALHDFTVLKELFDFNFKGLFTELHVEDTCFIEDFTSINGGSKVFNQRIRDRICALAVHLKETESVEEFKSVVTEFYRDFGVGKLGLHKAFRIVHNTDGAADLEPVTRIAHVKLDDLVGYEIAKKKLVDNTEAFVGGREANNCLLFGDAGTGKSTSIKAIANTYYEDGLRLIEVYKHQFQDLHAIISLIKNRNYKFIIYMDDLSFEEFEIEYKYLKAVIEGGLEKKPENVLIYATSNRRHLIRENFSDKEEIREDMHTSDTVQEKLSLVARFGVSIYFGAPNKKEFQEIVKTLAKRQNVALAEDVLLAEANKWELSHGGLSGRTAQQFINYLLGKQD
jgi:hypothetical protein